MLHPKNIIRSRRHTLALYVNPHGELIVKAPLKLSDQRIFAFIKTKEQWIQEQQSKVLQSSYINKSVLTYRTFFFLGTELSPLIDQRTKQITRHNNMLLIPAKLGSMPIEKVNKKIVKFLKDNAKQIVYDRADYFSQSLRLKYTNIAIMNNKTRWGVCSKDGKLGLNWRVIMLPPQLIDYIMVHEFCHLLEFNHSKQFWLIVESILPNWKELRKHLKQLGWLLELFRE